jgi:hypothetical protein
LGRIGLVFWVLAIIYNLSESSFFRLDALWFTLLLVMIECPRRPPRSDVVVAGEGNGTLASGEANTPSACVGAGLERSITKLLCSLLMPTNGNILRLRRAKVCFTTAAAGCQVVPFVRRSVWSLCQIRFKDSMSHAVAVSEFSAAVSNFPVFELEWLTARRPFLRRFGWWSSDKGFPSLALA